MADATVTIQPSGAAIDVSQLTVNGATVDRQRINIGDPTLAGGLAAVKAGSTAPAATDPALVVALSPNGATVADSNSTAFQGVVVITPGTAVAAKRSLGFICTVAGNITLTLADSSVITLPILVNGAQFQQFPFAVTNVALGTGTAGSFWNLV